MSDKEREARRLARQAELAAKRARLDNIKEENRKTTTAKKTGSSSSGGGLDLSSISNVDDLLKSLDQTTVAPLTPTKDPTSTGTPSSSTTTPSNSSSVPPSPQKSSQERSSSSLSEDLTSTSTPQTSATSSTSTSNADNLSIQLNVIVHDIAPKEIEVYNRSVQTDFIDSFTDPPASDSSSTSLPEPSTPVKQHPHRDSSSTSTPDRSQNNSNQASTSSEESNSNLSNPSNANSSSSSSVDQPLPTNFNVEFMDKDNQYKLVTSREFSNFFDSASKAIERVLYIGKSFGDPLSDFGFGRDKSRSGENSDDFDEEELDEYDRKQRKRTAKAKLSLTLTDPRWTKNRAVSDMAWSPRFNDLIAVSYSLPSSSSGPGDSSSASGARDEVASVIGAGDADGVVCIWSIHGTLQRPEYVFTCQSPVTSVLLPKYHPTLVVGGTYSGQIVLWDTRTKYGGGASGVVSNPNNLNNNSNLNSLNNSSSGNNNNVNNNNNITITTGGGPVQRTPLSSIGHTHPVYSLAGVGTTNANSLVTVSTDGKLCVWNYKSLYQPLEVLELRNKTSGRSVGVSGSVGGAGGIGGGGIGGGVGGGTAGGGNIAPICVAFPDEGGGNEVNEFFVGAEDGGVYQAFRHGTKSGIYQSFLGHKGPVMSISFHPSQSSSNSLLSLSNALNNNNNNNASGANNNNGMNPNLLSLENSGNILSDTGSNISFSRDDFSDLFLTASVDWSSILWSKKQLSSDETSSSSSDSTSITTATNNNNNNKNKYVFEDVEYVYDVKWSPVHPAVWGSVNGAGEMSLWNINEDVESPVVKIGVGGRGVSKIGWGGDGRRVVCGDLGGNVYVYSLSGDVVGANGEVGEAEWNKMEQVVRGLRSAQEMK
eukprot:TRINITY_DN7616_c0_g1_i1.p1 TRINITY_DN7616_c0_g1~~TRINITY_DN7616_c0_g1_i1.p1  ORF type:complete len:875 (+),score=363.98 TRINITY_DN7616_c0_g1_i1:2490-5114(+)